MEKLRKIFKPTISNRLLLLSLMSAFIVGCEQASPEINEEESFSNKMDLGMILYRSKITTFEGDTEKADSAYKVDKKN